MKPALKIIFPIVLIGLAISAGAFLIPGKEAQYDQKEAALVNIATDPYYKIASIEEFEIFGRKPLYTKYLDLIKNRHLNWLKENLLTGETIYFEEADLNKESLANISMRVDPEAPQNLSFDFRGDFKMLAHLDSYLYLSVTKEDLNWYDGEENVSIKLLSPEEEVICQKTIPGDGKTGKDQKSAGPIVTDFFCPNLKKGTYEIHLSAEDQGSANDYVVRHLEINTPYFLIKNLVYSREPINLFLKNTEIERIKFYYWLGGLEQTISFISNEAEHELKLTESEKEKEITYNLLPGDWQIRVPKGGLVISGVDFALNPESWFDPNFNQKTYKLTNTGSGLDSIKDKKIEIR